MSLPLKKRPTTKRPLTRFALWLMKLDAKLCGASMTVTTKEVR